MKITEIAYARTFGRPNYGSEKLEMRAECDPSESPAAVALFLKGIVNARLGDISAGREYLNAAWAAQHTHIAPEGWFAHSADDMLAEARRDGFFDED